MSAINAAVKGAPSSFPWNLTQPHVHRPIKLVGEVIAHEVTRQPQALTHHEIVDDSI